MRPKVLLFRLLVAILIAGLPIMPRVVEAQGRSADSASVLKVAYDIIQAINTRDPVLGRAAMLPGSHFARVLDPDDPPAPPRYQSDSAFVASVGRTTGPRNLERIWDPKVFIQGTVALVHAPYDFFIDGVFSHCGVDTFTMLKVNGTWPVSHSAYTVQKVGCAPSDPVTFLVVPAVLAVVVALATWLPARRAMRMDPVRALRGSTADICQDVTKPATRTSS